LKTHWDYTDLAQAYLKRPEYAKDVLSDFFDFTQLTHGARVCDIGAGVAHFTRPLLQRGFEVTAIEPNDAMRTLGIMQTRDYSEIIWVEGTGEKTLQDGCSFDLVSFGSSFNVCDREDALQETARILKPEGWFVCLWNHRNLRDPIQADIEEIIQKYIPDYNYGLRRQSQSEFLMDSGYFKQIHFFSGKILHHMSFEDMSTAWRSHATLRRQSGHKFDLIISKIENHLNTFSVDQFEIPYTTRLWCGQMSS